MRIKGHRHRHERSRPRLLECLRNERNMTPMHSVEIADSNQRSTGWRRKVLVSGHELGKHASAIYYVTAVLPSGPLGGCPQKLSATWCADRASRSLTAFALCCSSGAPTAPTPNRSRTC